MRCDGVPEIALRCYAKINLTLEILGRRDDGYHDLSTIFQAVALHDELQVRLEPSERVAVDELRVAGLSVPIEGNLVLRAVEAYRREFGLIGQANLGLHKHIPIGAGLGGGSSDAAGVLKGLRALTAHGVNGERRPTPGPSRRPQTVCEGWGNGNGPDQRLVEVAAGLGSDVAFFLGSGTALGQGRGERLSALPVPEGWLVVAKPEAAVSTAEAYGLLTADDFTDGTRTQECAEALRAGCGLREVASDLYNGFAAPVERRWPEIRVLRDRLLELGAVNAMLSGSGSAVFGIFVEQAGSEAAAASLGADGIWAVATAPVARGLMINNE